MRPRSCPQQQSQKASKRACVPLMPTKTMQREGCTHNQSPGGRPESENSTWKSDGLRNEVKRRNGGEWGRGPSQLMVGPTSLTVSDRRSVKAVLQWRPLGHVVGRKGPLTLLFMNTTCRYGAAPTPFCVRYLMDTVNRWYLNACMFTSICVEFVLPSKRGIDVADAASDVSTSTH